VRFFALQLAKNTGDQIEPNPTFVQNLRQSSLGIRTHLDRRTAKKTTSTKTDTPKTSTITHHQTPQTQLLLVR
jgi:hypothetical protein